MQILGKRSKVLLIIIAIVMLLALGVSFAMWDNMSTVKATTGRVAYSTAQLGDVIQYGRYYQTGEIGDDGEYEKTPIEWIVVDKDERAGQLTLMSKYILASGSYFGNRYIYQSEESGYYCNGTNVEIDGITYNQAYVESTARAFLNNLERRDLGGDSYDGSSYMTSINSSDKKIGKLLTSVGYSNSIYNFKDAEYSRPIYKDEYKNRPAARGFYDEAFSDTEKAMIVPKAIPGYIGHRWPNQLSDPTNMSYVEGVVDKVWLPSVTELNVMATNDLHTSPSDEASSTVFEYYKDKTGSDLEAILKTERTLFVKRSSKAMNYSIPVYEYQSVKVNDDIHDTLNSIDWFWTRSPMSNSVSSMRGINHLGLFAHFDTFNSYIGIRPCIILKY